METMNEIGELVEKSTDNSLSDVGLLHFLNEHKLDGSTISKTILGDKVIRQWFILVTPEVASEFLTRNIINRPLSKANCNKLSRQMKAGYWHL